MSKTIQLRRYKLAQGREDEFAKGWSSHIPALRRENGFTIEFAHLDRENSVFTWAVSVRGDEAAFKRTEQQYYDAKIKAGLGNGDPKILLHTSFSFVEPLLPER